MAFRSSLNSPGLRIERLGFRKWYERELLSGHAHMVLSILCAVAVMASMESFRDGPTVRMQNVVFVLVSAVIGVWALRRYVFLTMRAEEVANQAVCPDCGEYGRFGVVGQNPSRHETQVCCRKCAHRWTINSES